VHNRNMLNSRIWEIAFCVVAGSVYRRWGKNKNPRKDAPYFSDIARTPRTESGIKEKEKGHLSWLDVEWRAAGMHTMGEGGQAAKMKSQRTEHTTQKHTGSKGLRARLKGADREWK